VKKNSGRKETGMESVKENTKESTESKGGKWGTYVKNILIGLVGLMLVLAVAGAIARKFAG